MLVGFEAAGSSADGLGCSRRQTAAMGSRLFKRLVVVALDRGVLDGEVHPLDLTIRPRAVGLDQVLLNAVLVADAVEHVPAVEGYRA